MADHRKIVVKVGTNVLTGASGLLDIEIMTGLVAQLVALKNQGHQVILVSSGAVGAGRSLIAMTGESNRVVGRQVLAAVGQVRLMEHYRSLFEQHGLFCAQVLATKEDFRDRRHYLNMRNCFQALLRDDIIPVVNENDVVAVTELMFTDNDELAGLVAAMTGADLLIILSSVDGLLDGPPDHPDSKVITEIKPGDQRAVTFISPTRSSFGRGGMQTKFRMAHHSANLGIETYIANGRRPGILLDILNKKAACTRFAAARRPSNRKTWLAYHGGENKGIVYINEGAVAALRSTERVSSLLPIGIVRLEGDFQKGDLLRILSEDENPVALGVAQYSATTAQSYLGQHGKKPLVHYDYLFVY